MAHLGGDGWSEAQNWKMHQYCASFQNVGEAFIFEYTSSLHFLKFEGGGRRGWVVGGTSGRRWVVGGTWEEMGGKWTN